MYHLWGGGGSPFKLDSKTGNAIDRAGTEVQIMADLRSILTQVKTDPKWAETKVCDEPSWARECIRLISVNEKLKLKDVFDPNITEIYKGSKSGHLRAISEKTKINLKDMMFFDNEWGNCQTVAKIGVTVVYTPKGVTQQLFNEALEKFPSSEIIGKRRR